MGLSLDGDRELNISYMGTSFQKDSPARQARQECLPKSGRLCGKGAFSPVFKAQKRLKLPYLTIVYAPNRIASTRMGISIGKTYGNAVERNRTKRLIREFFRRNKDIFPKGHDVVFIPYKGLLRVDIKTYREILENSFKGKGIDNRRCKTVTENGTKNHN